MKPARPYMRSYRNRSRPMPGWRLALESSGFSGGFAGMDADDPLAAARGITLGLFLSLLLWAALYAAAG